MAVPNFILKFLWRASNACFRTLRVRKIETHALPKSTKSQFFILRIFNRNFFYKPHFCSSFRIVCQKSSCPPQASAFGAQLPRSCVVRPQTSGHRRATTGKRPQARSHRRATTEPSDHRRAATRVERPRASDRPKVTKS